MKTLTIILSWSSVLFTIIPFIKRDAWWIRIFDYPKIQLTSFSVCCLLLYAIFLPANDTHNLVLLISMIACIAYHIYLIIPYTFLYPKQSLNCHFAEDENVIGLLTFNVYMYNRDSQQLLQLIKTLQPNLILLVETDNWWKTQVSELKKNYPFYMEYPVSNTYGMLLFSKYALTDSKIDFLIEADVPSFDRSRRTFF